MCAGLMAKNPTLVEADFTRIKSEYYPALREGGGLIIANNIFTAVEVMARCQDDPDILCIEDGLQEWIAGKNGQNHQFTIKAAKYLKTLTFRKEGGGVTLATVSKIKLQSFCKRTAWGGKHSCC